MPKSTRPVASPRPFTEAEVRAKFLRYIHGLVDYWYKEDRRPDPREKLEGLAFSILVMLDGEAAALPGFTVVPRPHPDDTEYQKERGENWFPPLRLNEPCDIAGSLHDEFHKHKERV